MAVSTWNSAGGEPGNSRGEVKAGTETQLTEEQMADKEEVNRDDQENDSFSTPEEAGTLNQEVELIGGTRLPLSAALGGWDILQDMLDRNKDQFDALVAIVIDNRPLAELPAAAITGLRNRRAIREDGSVRPTLAAVLAASYQKPSQDLSVLRYSILHSGPEQVAQIREASAARQGRFWQTLLKDLEENHRAEQGNDTVQPGQGAGPRM